MTSPFQQIAPRYAELWSETSRGRAQREQVWREIDGLFRPGDRVLDMGCGIGDDAVHLMEMGARVVGIDSVFGMVAASRARGVDARQLAIEELPSIDLQFDGALSNFGALNCVEDLGGAGRSLARLIVPQGSLALCMMSRFCWRCDWRHLPQRWSGRAMWRGMNVYYRSARSIALAFAPHFEYRRKVSIGRGDHQLLVFKRRQEC